MRPAGALLFRIHTERTAAGLRTDKDLAPLVKQGEPAVVSASCSLDTGRVYVLTGAPAA